MCLDALAAAYPMENKKISNQIRKPRLTFVKHHPVTLHLQYSLFIHVSPVVCSTFHAGMP